MEAPVISSSLGAMVSLRSKLQSLVVSLERQRPNPLKDELEHLQQDLEAINTFLVNLSRSETPNRMVNHWMNEVRDLSYDIEDYIDTKMQPNKISKHRMNKKILSVVKQFRDIVKQSLERHERYELWRWASDPSRIVIAQDPVLTRHGKEATLVGMGESIDELIQCLKPDNNDAGVQGLLKVVSIVGPAGVGKTTLANEVYCKIGGQFECQAFVRASRLPDTRRLLRRMISQVREHQCPTYGRSVPDLIDNLREHLQQKRYLIVIDDLWETSSWDIIKSAFPGDAHCSRILITTDIEEVALECCNYQPNVKISRIPKSERILPSQATESAKDLVTHISAHDAIFKVKPLSINDSKELFFSKVFCSDSEPSKNLKNNPEEILRKCCGLPLATISVASIFASQPDNSELWCHVKEYLYSSVRNNLPPEDMLREIVTLSYNSLPCHLKTCLLYLTMYPHGYTFMKADLVKQWTAEGFISVIAGEDINQVAECYFDELVCRGFIQLDHINFSDEVIFYTVHSTVFEIISYKSIELNFATVVDYSETNTKLSTKVRRLSLSFSHAKYATKPKHITLSPVRSLTFYGLVECLPSITDFKLLRVLIIEFWGDKKEIDISAIYRLFQLKYICITTNIIVKLPVKMGGLKYLETFETYARLSTVPSDIVYLPNLLHLNLCGETKLPDLVGHIRSLRTLQSFDLSSNSEDNARSLGEMTNLHDLHLTCSTARSDGDLKRKLIAMVSSIGKLDKLKSLILAPCAPCPSIYLDCSSSISSSPVSLQRLELLPPICIFARLPKWIVELQRLCILKIVVRELATDDVNIIAGLQHLIVLSIYAKQPSAESIVFNRTAFPVLKNFKLSCGVLRLDFHAQAMPNLQRLSLEFNAHRGEKYADVLVGIEHLLNLEEIVVRIGAAPGAEESDSMAAESVLKKTVSNHSKSPSFNVRRAMPVEEEEKIIFDSGTPQFPYQPASSSPSDGQLNRPAPADITSQPDEIDVVHDMYLSTIIDPHLQTTQGDYCAARSASMDNVERMHIPYKLLKEMTGGFSDKYLLGHGTFGMVYKGKDKDGQEIAVKLLRQHMDLDGNVFGREFDNLRKLKHPNIVRLVGFCNEDEETICYSNGQPITAIDMHRALCFEYLQNGSLQKHLYEEHEGFDWETRYKIIKGICLGIKYLHMELESPLYHLDLKPGNILLDNDMVPKIADFGLSTLLGQDTSAKTLSAQGTLGYCPPEFIENKIISKEFDIFSLGVIILKIMCGPAVHSPDDGMEPKQFVKQVHKKWRERLQALQGYTSLEVDCQQVKKCIEMALKCTHKDRQKRPSIGYIVDQLAGTEKYKNDKAHLIEENTRIQVNTSSKEPSASIMKETTGGFGIANKGVHESSKMVSLQSHHSFAWMHRIPKNLPATFMKEITDDFSPNRELSHSVFGTVYKGVFPGGGQMIAVKRFAVNSPVPPGKLFETEVTNLMAIKHDNIVELVDYSHEAQKTVVLHNGRYVIVDVIESCVCYEYLPRGSLDKYLHGDITSINWDTRFKIIKGICQGLHFLHKEQVAPIVHMNLVPSSIWLDDNWEAKISDFCFSRLFGEELTRIYTVNISGNSGYMAPEYLYRGEISTMSDIYSLGILILEITTGEKNCADPEDRSARKFVDNVYQNWKTNEQRIYKYPSLDANGHMQVTRCLVIGLKCVEGDRNKRPSIMDIVDKLNGKRLSIFDEV